LLTGALVAVGAGNNKEWPSWDHAVNYNPGLALAFIPAIRWLSLKEVAFRVDGMVAAGMKPILLSPLRSA
jgi:hypothetical protein